MDNSLLKVITSMFVLVLVLGGCSALYKGPKSDHFDGTRFFNKSPDHTFSDMIKWLWEMDTVEWPEWIDDPEQSAPISRVQKGDLRFTYINHATTLIQVDGLNILTDPVWSARVGPFPGIGVKRVRDPGIRLEDLPALEYVLISHDHYDHLDLPTLKQVVKKHNPTILAGLGMKNYLNSNGFNNVVELDWWQSYKSDTSDIAITFVPSLHNSGRWPFLGNRTLWGGFVVDSPHGQIYFAGDTAYGDFLQDINERFGKIRLSIFPIGSYEKRWFMKSQHMNPDDAVRAHLLLKSGQSAGIHYATFAEHPEQAIDAHEKDLLTALDKYGLPESCFWILKFGEGKNVPNLD